MSFLRNFNGDINGVLLKAMQLNSKDIRNEWNANDVDGKAKLETHLSYNNDKSVATYEASGQKAWLLEHGSGSKMDDANENPDLPAYKHSEYWNNEREGTEIRTRPKLPMYKDLDNVPHHGSGVGMPHGINIEESQWHFHKDYKAIEPLHVMKQIIMGDTAINKMMEDAILDSVDAEIDRAMTGAML